jgi:hypothetical protein
MSAAPHAASLHHYECGGASRSTVSSVLIAVRAFGLRFKERVS